MDVVECRWSLSDGLEAAGGKVTHVYSQPGVYAIRLWVTDAAGDTAEDELQITVLAQETEDEGLDPLVYVPALVLLLAAAVYGSKKYVTSR